MDDNRDDNKNESEHQVVGSHSNNSNNLVDESGDQFESNSTIDTTPLHISNILECILKKFSPKEILRFRAVSTQWEDEASRILIYNTLYKRQDRMKRCIIDMNSVENAQKSAEKLRLIHCLSQKSKWPELLFKDVELSTWGSISHPSRKDILTSGSSDLRRLLDTFGSHVSQLRLQHYAEKDLTILNQCMSYIGATSFFRNVKTLYVWVDFDYLNINNDPQPLPLVDFGGNVNLINLSFHIHPNLRIADRVQAFCSLINVSSKLKRLILKESMLEQFLQILNAVPALTNNFQTLVICGRLKNVEKLSEIKLSRNLQVLSLCLGMPTALTTEHFKQRMSLLVELCNRVGQSLISLEVRHGGLKTDTAESEGIESIFVNSLQMMPLLRELTLNFTDQMSVEHCDFLKKLPSLKLLRIPGIKSWPTFLENYQPDHEGSSFVHNNLEKIYFFNGEYPTTLDDKTIQTLCSVLPKLSNLLIKLPDTIDRLELVKFFDEVAKMNALQDLDIHVNKFNCQDGRDEIMQGLSRLRNSMNLKKLQLNGFILSWENVRKFPFEKFLILKDVTKLMQIALIHPLEHEIQEPQFRTIAKAFADDRIHYISFYSKRNQDRTWLFDFDRNYRIKDDDSYFKQL